MSTRSAISSDAPAPSPLFPQRRRRAAFVRLMFHAGIARRLSRERSSLTCTSEVLWRVCAAIHARPASREYRTERPILTKAGPSPRIRAFASELSEIPIKRANSRGAKYSISSIWVTVPRHLRRLTTYSRRCPAWKCRIGPHFRGYFLFRNRGIALTLNPEQATRPAHRTVHRPLCKPAHEQIA